MKGCEAAKAELQNHSGADLLNAIRNGARHRPVFDAGRQHVRHVPRNSIPNAETYARITGDESFRGRRQFSTWQGNCGCGG
jgi:hypothetical protein